MFRLETYGVYAMALSGRTTLRLRQGRVLARKPAYNRFILKRVSPAYDCYAKSRPDTPDAVTQQRLPERCPTDAISAALLDASTLSNRAGAATSTLRRQILRHCDRLVWRRRDLALPAATDSPARVFARLGARDCVANPNASKPFGPDVLGRGRCSLLPIRPY